MVTSSATPDAHGVAVPRATAADFPRGTAIPAQPTVIIDAAARWRALSTWTLGSLANAIGHKPAVGAHEQLRWQGQALTVGTLLELLQTEPDADVDYMQGASIPLLFPELQPDLQPLLGVTQPNRMTYTPVPGNSSHNHISRLGFPELLIGARGKGIGTLHYDIGHEHAFITQIIGRKEFILIAPEHTERLYAAPRQHNQSMVTNVWEPDYERFPRLRDLPVQRVTVAPGETLFIPTNWWHISRGLDATVGVSFNSVTRANWPAFADYRVQRSGSGRRAQLLKLKLIALGMYLNIREAWGAPQQTDW